MIFTKCVAVERGSAVVKNTYLQKILVLDVVVKLLRSSEGAVLNYSECTLLVARPDVPEQRKMSMGST